MDSQLSIVLRQVNLPFVDIKIEIIDVIPNISIARLVSSSLRSPATLTKRPSTAWRQERH